MLSQPAKIRLYCGGAFPFDYLKPGYRERAGEDYRAQLLGSADLLLEKHSHVPIREGIHYTGPFYFESDGMDAETIVKTELQMIQNCTHAVFLLDEGNCPGTIAELILASTLHKQVAVFFVKKADAEETESDLHSPYWFSILASQSLNLHTCVTPCTSTQDAKHKILRYVHSLLPQSRTV